MRAPGRGSGRCRARGRHRPRLPPPREREAPPQASSGRRREGLSRPRREARDPPRLGRSTTTPTRPGRVARIRITLSPRMDCIGGALLAYSAIHGLCSGRPRDSKSRTLRVTRVRPWDSAVAAKKASIEPSTWPACWLRAIIRPQTSATRRSTSRIRPSKRSFRSSAIQLPTRRRGSARAAVSPSPTRHSSE